jgi:predicted DNA-binding transcriptional regulator AlpA
MNVKQLSEYISMPVATIYTYVHAGKIPDNCIKRIGRALKFEVMAVDKWITGASAAPTTAQEHKQSAH